jgi:hypothetical protein
MHCVLKRFAIAGLSCALVLPGVVAANPDLEKLIADPNTPIGQLTWDYWWWNARMPCLVPA